MNSLGSGSSGDVIFLFFEDGKFLNYREYMEMVYEFSNSFKEMGLEPGDRVSLKIEKKCSNFENMVPHTQQPGLLHLKKNS